MRAESIRRLRHRKSMAADVLRTTGFKHLRATQIAVLAALMSHSDLHLVESSSMTS